MDDPKLQFFHPQTLSILHVESKESLVDMVESYSNTIQAFLLRLGLSRTGCSESLTAKPNSLTVFHRGQPARPRSVATAQEAFRFLLSSL